MAPDKSLQVQTSSSAGEGSTSWHRRCCWSFQGLGAQRALMTKTSELSGMKKVEAVIRPFKLDEVKDALIALGVGGMMVTDVRGVGHQPEYRHPHAGVEYAIDLLPRTKIEIIVAGELVEPVVSVICKVAWTGSPGDGKVFVLPVVAAIRIRTGETGESAV